MTKSKFDFYEIVKICSENPKYKGINGKLAVIRGKSQNEETHERFYGIKIYESDGLIREFHEKDLQSTGKMADPKDFAPVDTIRVQVDPKTGEGKIMSDE